MEVSHAQLARVGADGEVRLLADATCTRSLHCQMCLNVDLTAVVYDCCGAIVCSSCSERLWAASQLKAALLRKCPVCLQPLLKKPSKKLFEQESGSSDRAQTSKLLSETVGGGGLSHKTEATRLMT